MQHLTQRAYQMRLKPATPDDRNRLQQLHLAMNAAVSAWAVSLLTLRGGISAKFGEEADETIRRWRRILCALSWFSVESADKAPAESIISGKDLSKKLLDRLALEGVTDLESWYADCKATLGASIREDAVWVDRAGIFDRTGASREDVWDLLDPVFGGVTGFFAQATDEADSALAVKVASQWLSSRFGKGKGSDFSALAAAYTDISGFGVPPGVEAATELLVRVSQFGPPNKVVKALRLLAKGQAFTPEEWAAVRAAAEDQAKKKGGAQGRKGPRPWSDAILAVVELACRIPYQMAKGTNHSFHTSALDIAIRRVGSHQRGQANQERERIEVGNSLPHIPMNAFEYLCAYTQRRTIETEAIHSYIVKERALGGWPEIFARWRSCANASERKNAVAAVQAAFAGKFGDARLFENLAEDAALDVWRHEDPEIGVSILPAFAQFCEKSEKLRDMKIPAYRHIDPYFHPIFTEFGSGRLKIAVAGRNVTLVGIEDNVITPVAADWQSFQLAGRDQKRRPNPKPPQPPNYDAIRLSLELHTNGKLVLPREELEAIGRVLQSNDTPPQRRQERVEKLWRRMPLRLNFAARVSTDGAWGAFAAEKGLPTGIADRLFAAENKSRKPRVRFQLSRIPGLKVVGVDLRMRHSAAVAEWEATSPEQLREWCEKAQEPLPSKEAMSFVLKIKNAHNRLTRVIFRRTAPDSFPDGTASPTSWARLVARKRVLLDGEGEEPRKASPLEIEEATRFFAQFGLKPPGETRIDLLQAETLRRAQIELRRHSTYGELAWLFGTDVRLKPNGETVNLTEFELLNRLKRGLSAWHRLAFGRFDVDQWAGNQWAAMLGRDAAQRPDLDDARRILEKRREISSIFRKEWERRDEEWVKRLSWVQDWILPRKGKSRGEYMHCGGLSLSRIRLIEDLDAIVRSFRGRPTPDTIKPKRRTFTGFPGERANIRKIASRLREERCRKTAAAVVRFALGNESGFEPAHVVVIEDLSRFRPDASTRKRDENRKLVDWCASRTAALIKNATEVKGIRLVTIPSQYTSLQFAATGTPGLPCSSLKAGDFLVNNYWRNEVQYAQKAGKNATERQLFLLKISEKVQNLLKSALSMTTVTVPDRAGKIFVSLNGLSHPVDTNAAANIGLRPLMDPEFSGSYWYIPVTGNEKTVKPSSKDTDGCGLLQDFTPVLKTEIGKGAIVNLWRDPVSETSLSSEGWVGYKDYVQQVESRLVSFLNTLGVFR